MTNDALRREASTGKVHIKIAGVIWALAFTLIMAVSVAWIVMAVLAFDYYSISKGVRDAADSGSGVLSQLATLRSIGPWLLPLSFLSIATFLLGFGFAFANIYQNILLRGNTMAAALPLLKERKAHS